ncbi:hypothetical protein [Brachyspira hyodysenteriae]|uniref:Uncharacterized protein n=2 Tax=Brachyspira hyodysenteriae TaxID=159 RepID=A0A3B6VT80_BRAHO|nr:hypothetical protein BHYOB78_09790 [Brachyspira hyodysenteriae ATCC 27164]KLI14345.1 hypothetical protein SU44_11095 [Brachyspira hyodysenteriae]KLI17305.1 hypothetical protein SU45_05935 [Brachyspira hyodysenteriae]KLI22410.1 hypothetical protein SU43_08860 [Brachyspira hyodysenteriae]KLI28655.1 hypothetical protein SZ47_01655 [Brachyspira hyodysenteriae]
MIKHFIFIIFIYCLNAYSIMSDDIYKLNDLKYNGYDIYREKSHISGFHKDEYNYNLFLEDDNFDTNKLFVQTFDRDANIELKINDSKQNQKYNIKILEINIIKLGKILNTYNINIYPTLFNLEITDGYNNYKSIKENKTFIIKIPKQIIDNINERNINSFLKMDFYLNGSKKIKNFKEINNNTKTFDIELFSRYPYYFNVYNIKVISE